MLKIFKRKEPVISLAEHERVRDQRDYWRDINRDLHRRNTDLQKELSEVRGKLNRILAPLKAANEARRGKKRETV